MSLALQPITFAEAARYVRDHHRHHRPPVGWLFGTAANDGERVVGVVMVGRPVSRILDADCYTEEATRLYTDGSPHVASMLYAAAWRAARALGYRRLITCTLASESGVSVRAAGWREVGRAGGGQLGACKPAAGGHASTRAENTLAAFGMSDAWCQDCGEQGHMLIPVVVKRFGRYRERRVCWACAEAYEAYDPPEADDDDDWLEEDEP